ncbi:MAG: hypothetical protein ACOX6N_04905 [Patescibacteria group bacterium]|jgi:hypothetical protein
MLKNIKILRPLLAILILFIPLYPKFPLANVKGTYVAIRLDDIIVALAIIIWGIYQIKNKFSIFKHHVTKLFIAYFIAIIVSTVNAIFVYQTEPTSILLLHLLRRFEYMSLFFITIDAIQTKKDLTFPYISLVAASIGVSLYGYGQKYFGLPVISTMNEEFSKGMLLEMDFWTRISSTFAGHYDLAAFLSVVLVIVLAVTIFVKNIWLKLLSIIIWLVAFQILTFTASRVSTFAFWGGAILTLLLIRKFLWIIPVSLLMAYSVFFSADLNQRLLATIPSLKQYIPQIQLKKAKPTPESTPTPTPTIPPVAIVSQTPKKPTSNQSTPTPAPTITRVRPQEDDYTIDADAGVARSGEIRFNAEWPRAITAFRKNLIVGSGLGSITLATDNDYLRLLGESGIFGFITFMAIFVYFFVETLPFIFKKKRSSLEITALILFGGLIVMLANATLIDVFEASKTAYLFWIMMGVYYRVITLAKKNK